MQGEGGRGSSLVAIPLWSEGEENRDARPSCRERPRCGPGESLRRCAHAPPGVEPSLAAADQLASCPAGGKPGTSLFFLPRWQPETRRGIGLASSTSPCVGARGWRGRPSTRRCRPWGRLSWPPTSLSPVSAPLVCRVLGGTRGVHGGSRRPSACIEGVQEEPQPAHPPSQHEQIERVPHSGSVAAACLMGGAEHSRGEWTVRERYRNSWPCRSAVQGSWGGLATGACRPCSRPVAIPPARATRVSHHGWRASGRLGAFPTMVCP